MPLAWRLRPTCFFSRLIAFLCLWMIVSGLSLGDLIIGTITAAGSAWASITLLPCADRPLRFCAWLRLALRIPLQALGAGADVARRALDPALPLRPGFVAYSTSLPEGTAQDAFAALGAMQPGSVPVRADRHGGFDIHCLDTRLPVVPTLAREETALREALGLEPPCG